MIYIFNRNKILYISIHEASDENMFYHIKYSLFSLSKFQEYHDENFAIVINILIHKIFGQTVNEGDFLFCKFSPTVPAITTTKD